MAGARDYYSEARDLAADLDTEGHDEWSERLNNAIVAGATGTEIMMALRWELDQFLRSGAIVDDDLVRRAEDLRAGLDEALE